MVLEHVVDTDEAELNHYEHAIECLTEAEKRHETLNIMLTERDYSDVVRQSASIVDLSLRSLLQFAGVDPVGRDDLMPLVEDSVGRLPQLGRQDVRRMRDIYRRMAVKRKKVQKIKIRLEGEEVEPVRTRRRGPRFSREDALRAIRWSGFMVETAQRIIKDFDE